MKKMMKRLKNERGLTLVELLAVIVILAIISTIAFVMIGNVMDNAKKDAHIANAQQLVASAKLYDVTEGFEDDGDTVTGDKLYTDGYIDVLINPWSKDPYTEGEALVKKDGVDYKVTLPATECTTTGISATPETELSAKNARDTLCKD